LELIIKQGKIGETYCLGGGNEKNNLEISRAILKIMGQKEEMIEYVSDRPGHDLRYAIDFSKAKQELGFKPKYSFNKGLKETVIWYHKNRAWWEKVKLNKK